jgi:integrase
MDHRVEKKGELASSTINHVLDLTRAILAQAEADGILDSNPARLVRPVKLEQAQRGIFEIDEARELLADPGLWHDYRHYTINLLAATTGARLGEIRGLLVEDFCSDHVDIRHSWEDHSGLKEPKWGSQRSVPIGCRVRVALERVISETRPRTFLFYGEKSTDRPMSARPIENWLYEAMSRIGISPSERRARNLTFHSWRHWLNTALRSRGLADHKLRMITGHRTQTMSDHYTHYNASDFGEVMQLQESLFDSARSIIE